MSIRNSSAIFVRLFPAPEIAEEFRMPNEVDVSISTIIKSPLTFAIKCVFRPVTMFPSPK